VNLNLSADLKFYALVTYIYVSGNCYCRLTNACRAVLLVSKCLALMDLLSYAFYHYQTKGPSSSLLYLVYILFHCYFAKQQALLSFTVYIVYCACSLHCNIILLPIAYPSKRLQFCNKILPYVSSY